MTELVLCLILAVPLAWSAAVAGLRRLAAGKAVPDDAFEKYQLLIMVAPILIGALWIGLAPFVSVPVPLPLPPLAEAASHGTIAHLSTATPARAPFDLRLLLPAGVLAAWTIGALIRLTPLGLALWRLRRIARRADEGAIDGVRVRLTDAPVPPLAWGRATVLLPLALTKTMAPHDLRLIIRHEQAHLSRRDPLYFATLGVLDAVLWFNPFLRAQTGRCRLAAELACDAAASGKNAMEREAYARVLIQTLKHTAGSVRQHVPAAISNVKSGDYRMRLSEIMHADPAARKPKRRWLYIALAAALVPVALVQFAWAQDGSPAPVALSAPTSTPVMPTVPVTGFMAPVAAPVSVAFGPRTNRETGKIDFHQGVDFAVPVGTPVRASADGVITEVTTKWGYGKIVEIDHTDGLKTRYAHLDGQQVAVGDHVKAGQIFAASGATGTLADAGPHLHFEVWKDGKPIDPATVLPAAK